VIATITTITVTLAPQPIASRARAACVYLTHVERRIVMQRRRRTMSELRLARLYMLGIVAPARSPRGWRWTPFASDVRRVLLREGLVGIALTRALASGRIPSGP
jgi:hypothetical protein